MKNLLSMAVATLIVSAPYAQQPKKGSYDSFLERNPNTRKVHWSEGDQRVIIESKTGKKEVYDLRIESERMAMQRKWGQLLEPMRPLPHPAETATPPPPLIEEPGRKPPPPPVVIEPVLAEPPPAPPLHRNKPPRVKMVPPPHTPKQKKSSSAS